MTPRRFTQTSHRPTQLDPGEWPSEPTRPLATVGLTPEVLAERLGLSFSVDEDDLGRMRLAAVRVEGSGRVFGLVHYEDSPEPGTQVYDYAASGMAEDAIVELLDGLGLDRGDLTWTASSPGDAYLAWLEEALRDVEGSQVPKTAFDVGPALAAAGGEVVHDADDETRWNEARWDETVDRFAPLVWSIARSHGLGTDDAVDVSQTVWLRLLERLPECRRTSDIARQLVKVASEESLRVLRQRSGEARVLQDAASNVDHDAGAPQVDRTTGEENSVWDAFRRLPPRCQLLLRLLVVDPPLTHTEIASVLEMPVGSVGPTRARCIDRLREHLAP